jgi:hypothetical protein
MAHDLARVHGKNGRVLIEVLPHSLVDILEQKMGNANSMADPERIAQMRSPTRQACGGCENQGVSPGFVTSAMMVKVCLSVSFVGGMLVPVFESSCRRLSGGRFPSQL